MPKIIENFFENNVFSYQSFECSCVSDSIHINPNEPAATRYKVMSDSSNKIQFAYAAKKGLVRINPNGTIAENNVLGDFIATINNKNPDYAAFFKKNGFLFPISESDYEEILPEQLTIIGERLRNTVELMSGVSSIHKNYNKLLALIFLLITSENISIQTTRMEHEYQTCNHVITSLLHDASTIEQRTDLGIVRFEKDTYSVYDTMINDKTEVDIQEYNDITGGYNTSMTPEMMYLYVNYNQDITIKQEIDLIYHLFHDFGVVSDISYEKGVIFENGKIDFSEEFKELIIIVAKNIIGEEINSNLSGIYPLYDIKTMSPSWKVDSLLSALYFSIFYIKPDMELYRQCANPRCGKYFLVKTTSTRTKYCSQECCNRVTQDTYRKKRRMNE